jgi:diaminopimelate epimerase
MEMTEAAAMRFTKMQGAGNDFVVLDLRDGTPRPDPALAARLADRHFGVGCDQLLTIEAPRSPGAVAAYGIWNADGSLAGQCGNGARCVAAWLVRDGAAMGAEFVMDSPYASHAVQRLDDGRYAVAMGRPQFAPAQIPLAGVEQVQPIYAAGLDGIEVFFSALSMGNPHAVIEVNDIEAAPVERWGAQLQRHALFPDSVNVGFAQVVSRDRIRLRVFERGAGETLACGSGACAAAVALMRLERIDREVTVSLPGGDLQIRWPDDKSEVVMAGPATFVFEGEWTQ